MLIVPSASVNPAKKEKKCFLFLNIHSGRLEPEPEKAFERYIDIEFERRDEAIALAHELRSLYTNQLEWLKSLI